MHLSVEHRGAKREDLVLTRLVDITTRMLAIVRGAHDEVRRSKGGAIPSPSEWRIADINEVIESSILSVKSTAHLTVGEQRVTFLREYSRNLKVYCQRERLKQVFVNIIKNAYDAVGERGGKMKIVSTKRRFSNPDRPDEVLVTLSDDGEGITPDNLTKVCDQGFSTRTGIGRGFGLYVADIILKELNGKMQITSPAIGASCGTTIRLILPTESHRKPNPTLEES